MITLTDEDFSPTGVCTADDKLRKHGNKIKEKVVIATTNLVQITFPYDTLEFTRGLVLRAAEIQLIVFKGLTIFNGKSSLIVDRNTAIPLQVIVNNGLTSAADLIFPTGSNIVVQGELILQGSFYAFSLRVDGNTAITKNLETQGNITIHGSLLLGGDLVAKGIVQVALPVIKIGGSLAALGDVSFGGPLSLINDKEVFIDSLVTIEGNCDIIGSLYTDAKGIIIGENLYASRRIIAGGNITCGGTLSALYNIFAGMSFNPLQNEREKATVVCSKLLQGEIFNADVTFKETSKKSISRGERLLRFNRLERKVRKPQARQEE